MVIPWVGLPLGPLLKRLELTSRAKYVAFTTLLVPDQMPGQRRGVLDWPYVEGLRIDEVMHPLAILAVGLYGKALPFEKFVQLMMQQARAEQRLRTAQERRVRHGKFSSL